MNADMLPRNIKKISSLLLKSMVSLATSCTEVPDASKAAACRHNASRTVHETGLRRFNMLARRLRCFAVVVDGPTLKVKERKGS